MPFAGFPGVMLRPILLLYILLVLLPSAQAIQLGESRQQIVAQYGVPTSGNGNLDQGMVSYRWPGWHLDIEFAQGVTQRLIFTKDPRPDQRC